MKTNGNVILYKLKNLSGCSVEKDSKRELSSHARKSPRMNYSVSCDEGLMHSEGLEPR